MLSSVAAVYISMGLVSAHGAGLILHEHRTPILAVNAHALVAVSLASLKRKESSWKTNDHERQDFAHDNCRQR